MAILRSFRNANHLAMRGEECTKLETRRLYLFQQFSDGGGGGGGRVCGNDGIGRAAAANDVLGLKGVCYHLHQHVRVCRGYNDNDIASFPRVCVAFGGQRWGPEPAPKVSRKQYRFW